MPTLQKTFRLTMPVIIAVAVAQAGVLISLNLDNILHWVANLLR